MGNEHSNCCEIIVDMCSKNPLQSAVKPLHLPISLQAIWQCAKFNYSHKSKNKVSALIGQEFLRDAFCNISAYWLAITTASSHFVK